MTYALPYAGLEIVVSHHLPRTHIADAVYPYRWHRFWRWLFRAVGRPEPLTMERGQAIYEDGPMLKMGNRVICSPRQFIELKRLTPA